MTIHRPHPITGPWPYSRAKPRMDGHPEGLVDREPTDESLIYDDPDDAVLYDGCTRCAEHASHPFHSLDDDHLRPLVEAALAGGLANDPPRQPTRIQDVAVQTIREEWRAANGVLQHAHRVTGAVPLWIRGRGLAARSGSVEIPLRDLPWRPDRKDRKTTGGTDR